MYYVLGVFIGFFIVASIALPILIVSLYKERKQHDEDYERWDKETRNLQKELAEKEKDDIRSKGCENRIVELNNRIEEKQAHIHTMDLEIQRKMDDIETTVIRWAYINKLKNEYNAKLEKIQSERDITAEELKTINEGLEASKTAEQECSKVIENLKKEIETLKEQKRLAILHQNELKEDLWELDIDDKEKALISILDRIKIDYSSIQMDISSIEWRKIWLPKMQDLCNEKGLDRKGIYRLVLKSDENVCYVGQAQSIKDRWYQHIKKMIGVEPKGGEKLYKYRPEDFYWTVVEFDSKDLNASEHYWIDYFGCKEIGLNKKA